MGRFFKASANTRFKMTIFALSLVTLYSWRAGWKEAMFSAFCTVVTALVATYIGPHTFEAVRKPSAPPVEEAPK